VNPDFGLRAASAAAADRVSAYSRGPFTVPRKVVTPSAPRVLLASTLIAMPAGVGALLAEWLATGQGLAFHLQRAQQTFGHGGVWSAVVAVTAASVAIYALVGLAVVHARHAPAPVRGT
jgi:ABC-type nitrate/sulfonate/bicarbonate transport system permease component